MTGKEARAELMSRRKEVAEVLELVANCCMAFERCEQGCPLRWRDTNLCPISDTPENWVISEELSAEEDQEDG